jgi:hypothetical protein
MLVFFADALGRATRTKHHDHHPISPVDMAFALTSTIAHIVRHGDQYVY